KVLARAKKHKTTTILNASPAAAVPKMALEHIDYFIVNELEAHQFAKSIGLDDDNPHTLVEKLARAGKMTCIITLEDKGSVASTGDGVWMVGALPVDVIDSTGAGDTFCGVFAA